MTKKKYFLMTWNLRGNKEANLNISFKRWCYNFFFFFKRTILTQNSIKYSTQLWVVPNEHKISKWECLTFGWLFKKGKIPSGRSLSLSMKTHFIFIYMRWCSFIFHTTQKDEFWNEKSVCFALSSPQPFHHLLLVAILVISGINCWKCYPGPIWRYLSLSISVICV